jgi:hypothetical protein
MESGTFAVLHTVHIRVTFIPYYKIEVINHYITSYCAADLP